MATTHRQRIDLQARILHVLMNTDTRYGRDSVHMSLSTTSLHRLVVTEPVGDSKYRRQPVPGYQNTTPAMVRNACKKLEETGYIENNAWSENRAEWKVITADEKATRQADEAAHTNNRRITRNILAAAKIQITDDRYGTDVTSTGSVTLDTVQLQMLIAAVKAGNL